MDNIIRGVDWKRVSNTEVEMLYIHLVLKVLCDGHVFVACIIMKHYDFMDPNNDSCISIL